MQIILVKAAPIIATLEIVATLDFLCVGNSVTIRKIPYPPNFSSTAARIIDPAIGAST